MLEPKVAGVATAAAESEEAGNEDEWISWSVPFGTFVSFLSHRTSYLPCDSRGFFSIWIPSPVLVELRYIF